MTKISGKSGRKGITRSRFVSAAQAPRARQSHPFKEHSSTELFSLGPMSDRIFGSVGLVFALLFIWAAFHIELSFISDPVGPRRLGACAVEKIERA